MKGRKTRILLIFFTVGLGQLLAQPAAALDHEDEWIFPKEHADGSTIGFGEIGEYKTIFNSNDGLFAPYNDQPNNVGSNPNGPNAYSFHLGATTSNPPVGDAIPIVLILALAYGLWLFHLKKKM